MAARDNESGISVYPRLPVPSRRSTDPRSGAGFDRRLIALVAASVIAGGAGAWFLRPAIAPDPRIAAANQRATEAAQTATAQKDRADALEKSLDSAARGRRDADSRLAVAEAAQAQLAGKTADDATRRKATEAIQAKLRGAIDRSTGTVAIEGGDVHLQISDRVLFRPGDDALTDRGKAVLTRVAAALKDVPDKLVWVQGHTDEQSRPVKPAPPNKGGKPAPPPPLRFPTSWELSAARALAVVHYFQDVAKLDPARLAALAFGPYAPVATKDRAASRRLEIVLVARPPAK